MLLIQFFFIIFFLFAIGKVVGRYQARELSLSATFFWIIFWIAAGAVAVMPDSTMYVARILGVGRGADLVIYFSLAIIFFVLFRMMVKMERMNRDVTLVVRKLSLNEVEQGKNTQGASSIKFQ